MNSVEMKQYLLGSIGDMLNGDYTEPEEHQNDIVISWIHGVRVKTTVHVDPAFSDFLSRIYTDDYDLYAATFDQLEDVISTKAFHQTTDETWFISKEILEIEVEKINRGEF